MHISQSTKAAAAAMAALASFALAGGIAVGQAQAASAGDDTQPTSAEIVSQVSYYGDYEGNETVDGWTAELAERREDADKKLQGVLEKMRARQDVDWDSCRKPVAEIRGDLAHAMSIADVKATVKKIASLDGTAEEMIAARDAEIEAERIAAEEAAAAEAAAQAAAEAAYYSDYSSGGGYYPTGGLTPQSGVNYYGDQRETYYSSRVLHHYQTDQWQVDDEGFYREGDYYVVAANDGQYQNGDTYVGSKGTCIVRDSGCAYGTTDYYVAW